MTQQRLPIGRPRRPKAKRDMFGARENRHMVGQAVNKSEWRRDVHGFHMIIASAGSSDNAFSSVITPPGTGFMRQTRRIAVHGALTTNPSSSADTLQNFGGVIEFQMGLAEDGPAFGRMQGQSDAPGLFRRYITFAQSTAAFKFWLPSGFDQSGAEVATPAGNSLGLYVGVTVRAITDSGTYMEVVGILSTQEKELRIYA